MSRRCHSGSGMKWSYTLHVSPLLRPGRAKQRKKRDIPFSFFNVRGAGGGRSEILALQTAATNLPKSESGPTQDGATVRKLEINSRADNLGN